MQILDVLGARLDMLVEREQLEAGEAKIAKHALSVLFATADPTEILTAIENATWMDKTVHEVGHPEQLTGEAGKLIDVALEAPSVKRTRPIREGVDNDGLTDAEATAALDEQSTWPTDEFGREIDPALRNIDTTKNNIAMFAKVNGTWRFEGFMGKAHSVISEPVAEFRALVEGENGPGTAFVVKLPS